MKRMTIQAAACQFVAERNATKLTDLLDRLADEGIGNPADLPLICDITRCGEDGHSFAWAVLEDWQNS